MQDRWRRVARPMIGWSLLLALISGMAWLLLASLNMSDWEPGESFPWSAVGLVWRATQFGLLWKIRAGLWAIVCVFAASLFARRRSNSRAGWIFLPAAALLGSLAWAGHGTEGSPSSLHAVADVLHLLICAAWPSCLIPLLVVLFAARKLPAPERQSYIPALIDRFSTVSVGAVAILIASGVVNSLFLVGTWSKLIHSQYGRLLLLKIAMTAGAVALGAINLLILRRRLARSEVALRLLRINVSLELAVVIVILLIVGWLGLMQPGIG